MEENLELTEEEALKQYLAEEAAYKANFNARVEARYNKLQGQLRQAAGADPRMNDTSFVYEFDMFRENYMGPHTGENPYKEKSKPNLTEATLVGIHDGDTGWFQIGEDQPFKVRFANIHAREVDNPVTGKKGEPGGLEDKTFLLDNIKIGDKVGLADAGYNSYDRRVMSVYYGDGLNQRLDITMAKGGASQPAENYTSSQLEWLKQNRDALVSYPEVKQSNQKESTVNNNKKKGKPLFSLSNVGFSLNQMNEFLQESLKTLPVNPLPIPKLTNITDTIPDVNNTPVETVYTGPMSRNDTTTYKDRINDFSNIINLFPDLKKGKKNESVNQYDQENDLILKGIEKYKERYKIPSFGYDNNQTSSKSESKLTEENDPILKGIEEYKKRFAYDIPNFGYDTTTNYDSSFENELIDENKYEYDFMNYNKKSNPITEMINMMNNPFSREVVERPKYSAQHIFETYTETGKEWNDKLKNDPIYITNKAKEIINEINQAPFQQDASLTIDFTYDENDKHLSLIDYRYVKEQMSHEIAAMEKVEERYNKYKESKKQVDERTLGMYIYHRDPRYWQTPMYMNRTLQQLRKEAMRMQKKYGVFSHEEMIDNQHLLPKEYQAFLRKKKRFNDLQEKDRRLRLDEDRSLWIPTKYAQAKKEEATKTFFQLASKNEQIAYFNSDALGKKVLLQKYKLDWQWLDLDINYYVYYKDGERRITDKKYTQWDLRHFSDDPDFYK